MRFVAVAHENITSAKQCALIKIHFRIENFRTIKRSDKFLSECLNFPKSDDIRKFLGPDVLDSVTIEGNRKRKKFGALKV